MHYAPTTVSPGDSCSYSRPVRHPRLENGPTSLTQRTFWCLSRIALFYTCRTYILRTLYHDLRVLSSQSLSPSSHSDAAPTESAVFLSPGTTPVSLTPKLRPMDISDGDQSDATLPQPSTSSARRKPYHFWSATKTGAGQGLGATAAAALKSEGNNSSLARTTFAVCFSESCILFLMVLAQAAHLLSPR